VFDFDSQYQKLNPEQKKAVDTIEGPVMVIAGAGTGKTQTIALRIGKILQTTQVNPQNILCLTYTESAAINMRQRLISLIGSTGYGVRITTFHGFCNSIILDHPEYFLQTKSESVTLDDLRRLKILRSIIDSLPADSPLKNINSVYYYLPEITKTISNLKRENILPDRFSDIIASAQKFIDQTGPVIAKLAAMRATAKSAADVNKIVEDLISHTPDLNYRSRLDYFRHLDLTPSRLKQSIRDYFDGIKNHLCKNKELLFIYRQYQQSLKDQGLFDYDDMILWVINTFNSNPDLLAQYQEQYQYLLVDEFQDTNSSQYQILKLLNQHQSAPNIFVVGDDDQSIYRFQGASVENVYTFYRQYQKNISLIVLKNNYRSHRLILETSGSVIKNNQNRITRYIDNLDKTLIPAKNFDPDPVNLFVANSVDEENYHLASTIKQLIDNGNSLPEIAVLYRRHADIADLLPYLQQLKIRYLIADSQNILDKVEIQQLLTLIRYLSQPENSPLLAHVLSFNFLNFDAYQLFRYFHQARNKELSLYLQTKKYFSPFFHNVADIRQQADNLPADELFNLIIRQFGFLKYILDSSAFDLLKQLQRLYAHLKTTLLSEKISLWQWADDLSLLIDEHLSLDSRPLESDLDQSIRLMTVHKAKGLEFEHVFLIKLISGHWDSGSSRQLIRLPPGIISTDIANLSVDTDLEEDRRLFYVALTRAKRQIYLSYAKYNNSGREQLPSVFLQEIDPKLIDAKTSTADTERQTLLSQFNPEIPKLLSSTLSSYLHNYLSTSYRFNITHLNSYLHCPLCFFFKTILRLPHAKTRALSFGTSVHGSLNYLFQTLKSTGQLLSEQKFLEVFQKNLSRESLSKNDYSDLLAKGLNLLSGYYRHYQSQFSPQVLTEHDFKFYGIRLDDIPLTGKIDKIEIIDPRTVNVVDYKTGRPDNKYKELSPIGDYYRQLVFYKLLISLAKGFPYKVASGTIDFVQPDRSGRYLRKTYTINDEDTNRLKQQIKEVFAKIKNLEFAPSSDCSDPDHLHYLFGKYFS